MPNWPLLLIQVLKNDFVNLSDGWYPVPARAYGLQPYFDFLQLFFSIFYHVKMS